MQFPETREEFEARLLRQSDEADAGAYDHIFERTLNDMISPAAGRLHIRRRRHRPHRPEPARSCLDRGDIRRGAYRPNGQARSSLGRRSP